MPETPATPVLPPRPVERLTRPLERFLHLQAAGGIVLFLATVAALVVANSSFAVPYRDFWNSPFSVGVPAFRLTYPLWYWVNDGLMAIFFFVIGLEIKRELVWGELKDKRNVIIALLNLAGVRRVTVYVFVGAGIWLCTLKSGVHPTVAGALLGLMTPASAWLGNKALVQVIANAADRIQPLADTEDALATENTATTPDIT